MSHLHRQRHRRVIRERAGIDNGEKFPDGYQGERNARAADRREKIAPAAPPPAASTRAKRAKSKKRSTAKKRARRAA